MSRTFRRYNKKYMCFIFYQKVILLHSFFIRQFFSGCHNNHLNICLFFKIFQSLNQFFLVRKSITIIMQILHNFVFSFKGLFPSNFICTSYVKNKKCSCNAKAYRKNKFQHYNSKAIISSASTISTTIMMYM